MRFSSCYRRRIDRDRNDFDREYDRGNFRDKPRGRRADSRDRFFDDRDRDYDRGTRSRVAPPVPAPVQQPPWGGHRDSYYPPQDQPGPQHGFQNRYLILTVSRLFKRFNVWVGTTANDLIALLLN